MDFIGFSFLQGILAFLAPCAVALLPGYILAFISRNPESANSVSARLGRGFKLASLSILGILIIYSVAGLMIVLAGQVLKDYMKWITIVATQAMAAETIWEGSSYILACFAGISGMMILTILLAIFAKDFLLKNLRKILPYMEKVTAVLLIIAGVYVIYYQMALFAF